jgi:hypothetical protein
MDSSDVSAELLMKSAMLTDSNKTEMAEAHKKTFIIRKAWIDNKNKKPTGKEVVERFPRFLDMLVVVSNALLFFKK